MARRTGPGTRADTFGALRLPNFALYFYGQLVSQTGTWFQNLAISLLVLHLTGSASALALVTVAQFGPTLLLATVAGRLSDSLSPRTILLCTSAAAVFVTLGLAWAVSGEHPLLPVIYGLIVLSGTINVFDRVAAQAFIFELVGATLLQNAVVLSTVYISAARSVGPGLAGFAYAAFGPAACLLINACSYAGVFLALLLIRKRMLHPRPRVETGPVSTWSTIKEVRFNRPLLVLLIVNVIVTLTALNMNVVLTSVVSLSFAGTAVALGATHAFNAVGAIVGGLLVTRIRLVRVLTLVPACLVFAAALAVNSVAPNLAIFLAVAPLLGLGLGLYQGVLNSAAQGASPPHAIGRTMSLVTLGNIGMAPLGALAVGTLIDATSGRMALGVGAASCAVCASLVFLLLRRRVDQRVA